VVNRFRLTLLGLTMAAGLVIPATAAQASPATPSVASEGCPVGAVCIYPNAGWNGGHPSAEYFAYGTYNFSNQFGVKRVFNNLSSGWVALCTGFNGGGTCVWQPPGTFSDDNFTLILSMIISPIRG
jgi:hypothetical protein